MRIQGRDLIAGARAGAAACLAALLVACGGGGDDQANAPVAIRDSFGALLAADAGFGLRDAVSTARWRKARPLPAPRSC